MAAHSPPRLCARGRPSSRFPREHGACSSRGGRSTSPGHSHPSPRPRCGSSGFLQHHSHQLREILQLWRDVEISFAITLRAGPDRTDAAGRGERDAVLLELELLVSGQHSSKYACVLTTFPSQADNKRSAGKDPPQAWPVSAFTVPLERKRPLASATWVCCRALPCPPRGPGAEHPRGVRGASFSLPAPAGQPGDLTSHMQSWSQDSGSAKPSAALAGYSGQLRDDTPPQLSGLLLEALRFAGAARGVTRIGCMPEKRASAGTPGAWPS